MTKAYYLQNQTGNRLGSAASKHPLATVALSLLLTGCQWVDSSALSANKRETRSEVAEIEEIAEITEAAQTEQAAGIAGVVKIDEETPTTEVVASLEEPQPAAVAPAVVNDLWVRIQSGLGLNLDQNNSRIQAELNWYKSHQYYFSQIAKRSAPYLYFIVKEAEAREVPLELALMPIVESSYDPFAYSHAGASGLWQFMPETGEHFGLEQNWWYDGRRDVVRSTRAALDYLQSLHKRFGDWELALAAFNSGPGRVSRAVRQNREQGKSTRFWALDLPSETTAYVPKLIAISKVIRNPAKYGIKLPAIPNRPYFAKVQIGSQLDMAKAAQLSGVDIDELYRLNPGLNRWSTPPDGPHHLVIPVNHAEDFRTKLTTLSPEERLNWHHYTVKAGDNLSVIAERFSTSVEALQDINKLKSSIILVDQRLLMPMPAKASETYALSADQRLAPKQNSSVAGSYKIEYRVKSGDSVSSVAQKYNVDVNELARWNDMSPRQGLQLNQKLAIWKKKSARHTVMRKVNYKVRTGDSLSKIATKFNVNVDQIRDWNTDLNEGYIHPGQLVTLFVNVIRINY